MSETAIYMLTESGGQESRQHAVEGACLCPSDLLLHLKSFKPGSWKHPNWFTGLFTRVWFSQPLLAIAQGHLHPCHVSFSTCAGLGFLYSRVAVSSKSKL